MAEQGTLNAFRPIFAIPHHHCQKPRNPLLLLLSAIVSDLVSVRSPHANLAFPWTLYGHHPPKLFFKIYHLLISFELKI
jgi:hypothetical protein